MEKTSSFWTRFGTISIVLVAILLPLAIYAFNRRGTRSEPEKLEEYGHLRVDLAQQVAALDDEILSESDSGQKMIKVAELVDLYTEYQRQDLAAEVQRSLAEIVNTAEAWDLTGNLYFDWMLLVDGPEQVVFAKYSIDAYLQSLDLDPSNLGVRTDLGAAYLYYPGYMDEAFQTTRHVLSVNPDNVQANFNLGIMLARTKEGELAKKQFDRVKALTSELDPRFGEAEAAIVRLRSLQVEDN